MKKVNARWINENNNNWDINNYTEKQAQAESKSLIKRRIMAVLIHTIVA